LTGPRESDRVPAQLAPFCTGRMLVGSIHRAIQAVPFVVAIGLERLQQAIPLASLRPPIEPIEHCLPRTQFRWQVTPGNPCPPPQQHSLDEVPIVVAPPPHASLDPKKCFDPAPLHVRKLPSNHAAIPWSTLFRSWTALSFGSFVYGHGHVHVHGRTDSGTGPSTAGPYGVTQWRNRQGRCSPVS